MDNASQYKPLFDAFDRGSNGVVSVVSLKRALGSLGGEASAVQIQQMLDTREISPKVEHIDFQDFCFCCHTHQQYLAWQNRPE